MARFDADALLAAVDAELTPSETRVVFASRGYFFGELFMSLFVGALLVLLVGVVGFGGVILFTPLGGPNSVTTPKVDWLLLVYVALFLILILVFVVVVGARLVNAVRGLQDRQHTQVLVLAPNGFVARTGTTPRAVFSVAYAAVVTISLSIQHSRYDTTTYLSFTYQRLISDTAEAADAKDARATQLAVTSWKVDPRFGPPAMTAQAILEAHARAGVAPSVAD